MRTTQDLRLQQALSIRPYMQSDSKVEQLTIVLDNIAATRSYVGCYSRVDYAETLEAALAIEDAKTRALVASLAKKLQAADRDHEIAYMRLAAIAVQLSSIKNTIEGTSAKEETPKGME